MNAPTRNDVSYFRPSHFYEYPLVLSQAQGSQIWDRSGKPYLDFFAAMGTVSCGHAQPEINQALKSQIDTLWISSFFPTEVQLELIAEMDALFAPHLQLTSLSSTGAEAVEQGLRLARAFTQRNRFLAIRSHFHGKTHGTMHLMSSFPPSYGPADSGYRDILDFDLQAGPDQWESALEAYASAEVAGLIYEPVVGYSGPYRMPTDLLKRLRAFCDRHGIVMIADEILTGFHRCQGWLYSVDVGVIPDIVCFGKGVGNGFPVSGILTKPKLAHAMKDTAPGSTFAGNSLACATALSVLRFMKRHPMEAQVQAIERHFFDFFSQPQWKNRGLIPDGVGALLSLRWDDSFVSRWNDSFASRWEGSFASRWEDPSLDLMGPVYKNLLRDGVIASHTRTHLRLSPPLTIRPSELEQGLELIGKNLLEAGPLKKGQHST